MSTAPSTAASGRFAAATQAAGGGLVEAVDGIDPDLGDGVGVLLGDGLDLDAAFLGQHAEVLLGAAIEREAGVVLLGDVGGLLDPDPLDDVALDVEPQDVAGVLADGVDVGGELHTPGLAATTGVDLGLDHDRRAESLGSGDGFVDAERDLARRGGHSVGSEELLPLVFEQIHGFVAS